MARSYRYSIVRFRAHPVREERLNFALAIFHDDQLDVRPARRLEKLKAISAALDLDAVRDSVAALGEVDAVCRRSAAVMPQHRLEYLAALAPFEFSTLGEFHAPSAEAYEAQVTALLKALVEPEPAPAPEVRKKPTRLLRSVKMALKSEGILARKGEGLEAHRVVSNHQIAEGLTAELLLKNGAMHVVETVDAFADEAPLRRMISDVAISALVFEQARMTFGEDDTQAQLIYRASATLEPAITPSLLVAEHQGAQLINWESGDDQRRFLSYLAMLAEPVDRSRKTTGRPSIHASTQAKLNLN